MGWSTPQIFTLAPGGAMWLTTTWGSGSDEGAIYQMAAPRLANGQGGNLQVNNQTKHLDSNGNVSYSVLVTNVGGSTAVFNMQGLP
jgi:hypothetical protein